MTQPVDRGGTGNDVTTLIGQLGTEMSELVTKQMALARLELRDELAKGAKAGVSLSAAAVIGLVGFVFLSSAAAWGLTEVMAEGLAFLIVAGVQLAVAGALAVVGRRRLETVDPVPHQTIETLKEDAQWLKNHKS
jgi:uncharacterized membrane protein YqjE